MIDILFFILTLLLGPTDQNPARNQAQQPGRPQTEATELQQEKRGNGPINPNAEVGIGSSGWDDKN